MRRKDREVTDRERLLSILDRCKVCRIGMTDEQGVYVVPVNFGYEFAEGKLRLYVHGAKEGRKLSAISANPNVCVEMDCGHQLVEGDSACRYGYRFASIIGNGQAALVEKVEEKKHGLSVLMRHQTGKEFAFTDAQAAAVAVIRIDLDTFTGKCREAAER